MSDVERSGQRRERLLRKTLHLQELSHQGNASILIPSQPSSSHSRSSNDEALTNRSSRHLVCCTYRRHRMR